MIQPLDPYLIAPQHQKLHAVATEMETVFLAEMLKHSGLNSHDNPFSGGTGETHFASFLSEQHAIALAQNGGIGLAEMIFKSLSETQYET